MQSARDDAHDARRCCLACGATVPGSEPQSDDCVPPTLDALPPELLAMIIERSPATSFPVFPFVCRALASAHAALFSRARRRNGDPNADAGRALKRLKGGAYFRRLIEEHQMPLLRWAYDVGCPVPDDMVQAAAASGDLDVFLWCRRLALDIETRFGVCMCDRHKASVAAAINRHQHILEAIRQEWPAGSDFVSAISSFAPFL
jgi:hypothetical protein